MKKLRVVTITALLVFALCAPAEAQLTEPIITATVADTTTMTLLIEGFNLPKGAVYMGQPGGGAKKLNVISSSSTAIEAQLLSAEPGTYIVAIALSADQFWTGYVTVGAVGPKGDQGPPGISGYRNVVLLDSFSLAPGRYGIDGDCNPGEVVISGGIYGIGLTINGSYPISESTWRIAFSNDTGGNTTISASIICATVAP